MRRPSDSRCVIVAGLFLLLLFASTALALHPDLVNHPSASAINVLASSIPGSAELAFALTYPTLQGIVIVCFVWYCWFSLESAQLRARLVAGTLAAILAGILARLLQRALPTSPKPIFDAAVHLQVPSVLGDFDVLKATSFPNSHTFPSERATLFAGLAIAVLLVRHRIGWLALVCTMAAEFSRVYLGLHYPTDILGSVSLSAAAVWIAQMRWGSAVGGWFIRWERASAPTFYMCAYIASYELTTTFRGLLAIGTHPFR